MAKSSRLASSFSSNSNKLDDEQGRSRSKEYRRSSRDKKLLLAPSVEETCRTHGYLILKVIGTGSYGSVFLCRSRRKATDEAAVKVIDVTKVEKIFVDKFLQRELETLLLVRHPYIIHIRSIFFRNNRYYIFMRFAEKGDLFDLVSKNGKLETSRAKIWSAQLISALHYLHGLQIAHRDLKCENLLITKNDNLQLADFGFTRQYVLKNGKPLLLTTFCGTKHYASPEVISSRPYDPVKTDIWAFGVVLFIMLTGTMPFLANTQKKIRECQVKETWKSKVNFPDELMTIFRNVFALDQTKRWDTAQVMEANWYRSPQYMRASRRHASVQVGSDEYIRRIFLFKKNHVVMLPELGETELSHGTQAPSFMFAQTRSTDTADSLSQGTRRAHTRRPRRSG